MEVIAGDTKRVSGFTLIELLVTIAVVAILATVAVPSFQSLLERNQFAVEYNQVLSGLYYARSEAIKRRENVTAAVSQVDGSWQLVVTDSASNQLMVTEGEDDEVAVPSGSVTFNDLGRRDSCTDWASCTFDITSGSESETMGINVTGRISKSS